MGKPMVSVVILTKNEERNIGTCLRHLFSQNYRNFEVIVIDANSVDNTVKIAELYGCRVIEEQDGRGFGYARNLGIKASKGDLILFLDADVFLLSRDCLERAIYRFREHKADVLLARLRFPNTVLGKYLSMAFPNRLATDWGKYTPHNRFMLVNKVSLIDIGLYDENFVEGAEDVDLLYRMHLAGKKVVYDPEIEVFHAGGHSVEEWKGKAYRDGYSICKFNFKYGLKSGLIKLPIYPILASVYAALRVASFKMLYYNFVLAKWRRKGYKDALRDLKLRK
jgi:glycosyltransferase involved in cell wall biosynthesis